MKITVAVVVLVVCVSLFEARQIKTEKEISEKLAKDLRELEQYLDKRDGQTTDEPISDPVHVCDKNITDTVKQHVSDRAKDIKQAAMELARDVYFTSVMLSPVDFSNGTIDLKKGFGHVIGFLLGFHIVSQVKRGEEYIEHLVYDTMNLASLSIHKPGKASHIIDVALDVTNKYIEENFDQPTTDGSSSTKRESFADNDDFLNYMMYLFCSLNRQTWKEVRTDIKSVIRDGIGMLRFVSGFLRGTRVIFATERADEWGKLTAKGLFYLAHFVMEGNATALNESFYHARKIRMAVENALEEKPESSQEDSSSASTDTAGTADTSSDTSVGSTKRVLHGLTKNELTELLEIAIQKYQESEKNKK